MHYKFAEEKVKQLYDQSYSKDYRRIDDISVRSNFHRRTCRILQSLTTSFNHEISVLDIGCGSGRYFHCLNNTGSLTGIDVSPFMIKEAKNPARQDDVSIKNIVLRCENIFDSPLPENSFDFIYSIGVLGEHSPFDLFICDKVYKLLKSNGTFFFTVGDISSKQRKKSLKQKIVDYIYPILPSSFKLRVDKRYHSFFMTRGELEIIISNSGFQNFKIDRTVSSSPKWTGAHYECIAHKMT